MNGLCEGDSMRWLRIPFFPNICLRWCLRNLLLRFLLHHCRLILFLRRPFDWRIHIVIGEHRNLSRRRRILAHRRDRTIARRRSLASILSTVITRGDCNDLHHWWGWWFPNDNDFLRIDYSLLCCSFNSSFRSRCALTSRCRYVVEACRCSFTCISFALAEERWVAAAA